MAVSENYIKYVILESWRFFVLLLVLYCDYSTIQKLVQKSKDLENFIILYSEKIVL